MAVRDKTDFARRRRDFVFTDARDALGVSMIAWVKAEPAPNAGRWKKDWLSDKVFMRAGDLGHLGLCFPEEDGGQGGTRWCAQIRSATRILEAWLSDFRCRPTW